MPQFNPTARPSLLEGVSPCQTNAKAGFIARLFCDQDFAALDSSDLRQIALDPLAIKEHKRPIYQFLVGDVLIEKFLHQVIGGKDFQHLHMWRSVSLRAKILIENSRP